MTGVRTFMTGTSVAIVLAGPADDALREQQRPLFRSTTVSVSVDVSVRKGNSPVPNLTAADFVLTDNGVRQTVESLQIEAVPVDVTLAIDVSGSTRGLLGRYRSDVAAIAELLRPTDRLRLIAFGSQVDEPLRLTPVAGRAPVHRLVGSSNSAVYDGIAAALLRTPGIDRRHLIVALRTATTIGASCRRNCFSQRLGAARRCCTLSATSRLPWTRARSSVRVCSGQWSRSTMSQSSAAGIRGRDRRA